MLADAARLEREIGITNKIGGGRVEAENHRHQVRRIEWTDGDAELVDPVTRDRERFDVADAAGFVARFLEEGID
ncbi:hypothetical protein [Spirillospora sp. NPDC047279]|uniref:hypothetical protein n=1 Tax=Spirillospora sp. NPDC047279 TaxID=3155478 RepID=UPI00340A446D